MERGSLGTILEAGALEEAGMPSRQEMEEEQVGGGWEKWADVRFLVGEEWPPAVGGERRRAGWLGAPGGRWSPRGRMGSGRLTGFVGMSVDGMEGPTRRTSPGIPPLSGVPSLSRTPALVLGSCSCGSSPAAPAMGLSLGPQMEGGPQMMPKPPGAEREAAPIKPSLRPLEAGTSLG